jgi:hypothetical protein
MLNGIDPVILFEFSKEVAETVDEQVANCVATCQGLKTLPITAKKSTKEWNFPIPIYLSETLTGLYIDSESKSIDIETSVETTKDSDDPIVNQKGLSSMTTIKMVGSKDSIGLTLLLAMADLIFKKVTAKDYRITYLHGSVTLFEGLLHTFLVDQSSDNTLFQITVQLTAGKPTLKEEKTTTQVPRITGATPL